MSADVIERLDSIESLMRQFVAAGAEAGSSAERQRQDIATGYIVGRKKDGEVCLWMYSERLQFKIATIWKELLDTLPFRLDLSQQYPIATPPSREEAQASEYWRPCNVSLVFTATGELNEAGKMKYRFSHILGSAPSALAPAPAAVGCLDRKAAARAETVEALAEMIYPHFADAFTDAGRVVDFYRYVSGGADMLYAPAMLAACEAYAAMVASGSKSAVAGPVAKAVFAAVVE